jgi:hypothetical protein
MHYTFLPYHEQKEIRRDYRVRASIVSLFFLSLTLIVGIGSLFPAYIHASLEEGLHLRDVAALKQTSNAGVLAAAEKDLSGSTVIISALAGSVTPGPFSGVIADIVSARGNVEISSFAVTRAASSTLSIVIGGLAPTRDALLAFKGRLGALAPGISVTLPISELAHETNIQFSIQIVEPTS